MLIIVLLVVVSDAACAHTVVLNLTQLALRIVILILLRIILSPQLFVPLDLLLKQLRILLQLLLQSLVVFVQGLESVLEMRILGLHPLEILLLHAVDLSHLVDFSLSSLEPGLELSSLRIGHLKHLGSGGWAHPGWWG